MSFRLRASVLPLIATRVVLATPAIAAAHIDPDPTSVPAAAPATVAFAVEHGCDGSPTTKVEFKVPAEVTDAQAVAKEGWTSSTAGDVITFEGGPQDPHTGTTFSLTFTAPAEGTKLSFPVVQTCEVGEIAWIETAADAERPAPVVLVGAAGSTPVTAAVETEDAESGEHEHGTDDDHAEDDSDEVAAEPASSSDDDDSNAPLIIGGLVVAAAVLGGGAVAVRSRKGS